MFTRTLEKSIVGASKTFPSIVITGPRQSGKTTLVKKLFGKTHVYVNMEEIDVRIRANSDPKGFLSQHKTPIIIDEIQYVPELFSYIKSAIDQKRKPGQWIITGSQQYSLMKHVSDSLAGRVAVMSLLPFSFAEQMRRGRQTYDMESFLHAIKKQEIVHTHKTDIFSLLLRGSYPEIATNPKINRSIWCNSYITTYLERDIRNLKQVGDLQQFELFIRAIAARTGQILNLSDVARDIGISVPTAKTWISLLVTGYQVLLLYPYYKNIGKRLVKSPKIYMLDSGLATFLMGIHTKETLLGSPYMPHLFEAYIISDIYKRFHHCGIVPTMYYLRTQDGMEVDLIIEWGGGLHFFEIKSSATITPNHASSLLRIKRDMKDLVQNATVISNSNESFHVINDIYNYTIGDILSL